MGDTFWMFGKPSGLYLAGMAFDGSPEVYYGDILGPFATRAEAWRERDTYFPDLPRHFRIVTIENADHDPIPGKAINFAEDWFPSFPEDLTVGGTDETGYRVSDSEGIVHPLPFRNRENALAFLDYLRGRTIRAIASKGGSTKTKAKALAARRNGRRGGRPKKATSNV